MNQDSIRASVILPFLNAERFLNESVESVLAQTYSQWELVLVDDGSTDSSSAIALDYVQRHPGQIRYVEHPGHENRGISASRNLGLQHARGEFIAELDADDIWLPGKLEHEVPILAAHPEVGMLYGNSLFWYSWNGDPQDASRDYLPVIGAPTNVVLEPLGLLLKQLQGTAVSPCPCSVLLRKSVVERVGGSEEEFPVMHEDLVLYAKVMLAAPVLIVDGWWDRYRCYSGVSTSVSVMAQRAGTLNASHRRYLEWLSAYLRGHGLDNTEHMRLVLATLRGHRFPRVHRFVGVSRRGLHRLTAPIAHVRGIVDALQRGQAPPVGQVRMGDLRRVEPINRHWGWERGGPVDRHYIEDFLARYADDIRGRVLEVGDDAYTRQYGGRRVTRSDVLDVSERNTKATIVADLANADHIPDATFDCIILTQTLQYVYDVRAALRTLYRIVAPGGTLLLTVPGISQTTDDNLRACWYWSFTVPSVTRLAGELFPAACIEVESHGNVLTAISFLHGLARQELRPEELAITDSDFPLVITLRARKPLS